MYLEKKILSRDRIFALYVLYLLLSIMYIYIVFLQATADF